MVGGKGMWIHKIKNAEAGNCDAIASAAQLAGITHVLVKILDGTILYNMRPVIDAHGVTTWVDDLLPALVTACHNRGIQVWGWQYIYLGDPVLEGTRAKNRSAQFAFDGFVIDAEGECKGQPAKSRLYCNALHGITVPVALSTYRYPTLHPEFPWSVFLPSASIYMPQVYWQDAHNPAEQLQRTMNEWSNLVPPASIVPTGAAYYDGGWVVSAAEVIAFLNKAKALGLPTVNFWEWWYARNISGLWSAIANYDYGTQPPPPTQTISVNQFVCEQLYPLMVSKWGYSGPAPEREA